MSTSGHTKRITINAIVLVADAIGRAAGPFMWKDEFKPRNRVPFTIISACSIASAITLFVIRQYFVYENKKRDAEAAARDADGGDQYDNVYITVTENGKVVERRVDRVCLALFSFTTDLNASPASSLRLSKTLQTSRTESSVMPFRTSCDTDVSPIRARTGYGNGRRDT